MPPSADHDHPAEPAPDSTGTPAPPSIGPDTDLLADRSIWPEFDCSVDQALSVVGTRSALLMLREAFYGTRRFQDFAQRVGVSEAAAATRLRELVDHGLLRKSPYRRAGDRERYEYRLTDKGKDLLPVIIALMRWGDRWLTNDGGPIDLIHDSCGTAVHAEARCRCGHEVELNHLLVRPGPSLLRQTP